MKNVALQTIDTEIKGLELLHQKYKYDFTLSEKQLIKNMLKESPPPIQYRRKVNI